MLVVLTEQQVLSPRQVCQGCLLADRSGLPRWHQGRLSCALAAERAASSCPSRSRQTAPAPKSPKRFQCQMGFQLAEIN